MSKFTTLVIQMPDDAAGQERVAQGFALLKPFQTAMSQDDEMTVLDLIEAHEDFPAHVADDAREQAKERARASANAA